MLTKKLESECRRIAGVSRCPVVLVPGIEGPRAVGERGHSDFKGGGRCRNWYCARRAGYKVRYTRSTLRVEVGDAWLAMLVDQRLEGVAV